MFNDDNISLSDITKIISKYNSKSIFLVTGKNSYIKSGAKDKINKALESMNIVHFNEFSVNPKLEEAIIGAKKAKENNIEIIIALGGGSVMDMAKIIKAIYGQIENAERIAKGLINFKDHKIPLICIPTTAGSGSEATHFAVVYVDGHKYSLANKCLSPNNIILDGSLAISASRYQKACNVLDAISQAIESAWAVGATSKSIEISLKALSLCMNYFKEFVNGSNNIEVSQRMLEASSLSGQGINIAKTTAAHAWSYGLSTGHDVAHGHAVWATLPSIFKIHSLPLSELNLNDERGYDHLNAVMTRVSEILGIEDFNDIDRFFDEMLSSIDMKSHLVNDFKLSKKDRITMMDSLNIERMANNPVSFSKAQMNQIFYIN